MHQPAGQPLLLLTGATGYVSGRLLKALQAAGYRVRRLARRPEFLATWAAPGTDIVHGDSFDRDSLVAACTGVHTAYYLVHSMGRREISPSWTARRHGTSARQRTVRESGG